ncbi:MAG: DivIVA domain-containing protein [Candidatus Eisenbacteria bacterium]
MKISPLDIRKQTFRKTLRGVDEQEVASFLEMVADQVQEVIQENRVLRDRLATGDIQLENYQRIEEALRNALVTAEKVARDTKKNADQEVEIRLKDADLRAQKAVQTARGILESVRGDLVELTKQRRDFLARFRLVVETQLKMLDLKKVEYEGEEDVRRLQELQRELFDDLRLMRGLGSEERAPSPAAPPDLPKPAAEPAPSIDSEEAARSAGETT